MKTDNIVKLIVDLWEVLPNDIKTKIFDSIKNEIGKLLTELFKKQNLPKPMAITTMGTKPKYDPILVELAVELALNDGATTESVIRQKYELLQRAFNIEPEIKIETIIKNIEYSAQNPKNQEYMQKLSSLFEDEWRKTGYSKIATIASEIGYMKKKIFAIGNEQEFESLKTLMSNAFTQLRNAMEEQNTKRV